MSMCALAVGGACCVRHGICRLVLNVGRNVFYLGWRRALPLLQLLLRCAAGRFEAALDVLGGGRLLCTIVIRLFLWFFSAVRDALFFWVGEVLVPIRERVSFGLCITFLTLTASNPPFSEPGATDSLF